tara:strand:- start:541 stop:1125 length:585 start_codon:yes stop_codon:yes gene_type:complete
MATPFKMKNPILAKSASTGSPIMENYADSPAKLYLGKKTSRENEDGSTTTTRKHLLTGRTKITTKTSDYKKGEKGTKRVTKVDKKGTVRKDNYKTNNQSTDKSHVIKEKYRKDGSTKKTTVKTKDMITNKTKKNTYKKSKNAVESKHSSNPNRRNYQNEMYQASGGNAAGPVYGDADYHRDRVGEVRIRKDGTI